MAKASVAEYPWVGRCKENNKLTFIIMLAVMLRDSLLLQSTLIRVNIDFNVIIELEIKDTNMVLMG